jgi:hypothetical protein
MKPHPFSLVLTGGAVYDNLVQLISITACIRRIWIRGNGGIAFNLKLSGSTNVIPIGTNELYDSDWIEGGWRSPEIMINGIGTIHGEYW